MLITFIVYFLWCIKNIFYNQFSINSRNYSLSCNSLKSPLYLPMHYVALWRKASWTSRGSSWAIWTMRQSVSKICCCASTRTWLTRSRKTCAVLDTAFRTRSSPWPWSSKASVGHVGLLVNRCLLLRLVLVLIINYLKLWPKNYFV